MSTLIRRSFDVSHGSEGPKHDPYSYTEFSMFAEYADGNNKTVVVHHGLSEYVMVNGIVQRPSSTEELDLLLLQEVGITFSKLDRLAHKKEHPDRCPKCRSREFNCTGGFAGETIVFCVKCGSYISDNFSMSMIE